MTERSKGSKEIVNNILNQPNMQTNNNDVLFPGANLLGKDELAKGLQHVAALENMLSRATEKQKKIRKTHDTMQQYQEQPMTGYSLFKKEHERQAKAKSKNVKHASNCQN